MWHGPHRGGPGLQMEKLGRKNAGFLINGDRCGLMFKFCLFVFPQFDFLFSAGDLSHCGLCMNLYFVVAH